MSRLNFALLSDAFYLGSDQIKDTQAEIEKLKTLISGDVLKKSNNNINNIKDESSNVKESVKEIVKNERVGYSDNISVNFDKSGDDDFNLIKMIQHPKFEDIVKNYIIIKHPEWVNGNLNNNVYIPNKMNNLLKENFGNVNENVKNYILFFIFGMVVYLFLQKILKK